MTVEVFMLDGLGCYNESTSFINLLINRSHRVSVTLHLYVPRVNKLQQMKSVFINMDRCQVVYTVSHAAISYYEFPGCIKS